MRSDNLADCEIFWSSDSEGDTQEVSKQQVIPPFVNQPDEVSQVAHGNVNHKMSLPMATHHTQVGLTETYRLLSSHTLRQKVLTAMQASKLKDPESCLALEAMEIPVRLVNLVSGEEMCQIAVLIDSGSVLCVMQQVAFERAAGTLAMLQKCGHTELVGFGGDIRILGTVSMPLIAGNVRFTQDVHIIPDDARLPLMVLGVDWMQTHKVSLKCDRNVIKLYGEEIALGEGTNTCKTLPLRFRKAEMQNPHPPQPAARPNVVHAQLLETLAKINAMASNLNHRWDDMTATERRIFYDRVTALKVESTPTFHRVVHPGWQDYALGHYPEDEEDEEEEALDLQEPIQPQPENPFQ